MDKTLYSTKPDGGNRPAKEMETYELLEKLNIPYMRVDHQPVATVDACAEVEAILGIEICKKIKTTDILHKFLRHTGHEPVIIG